MIGSRGESTLGVVADIVDAISAIVIVISVVAADLPSWVPKLPEVRDYTHLPADLVFRTQETRFVIHSFCLFELIRENKKGFQFNFVCLFV